MLKIKIKMKIKIYKQQKTQKNLEKLVKKKQKSIKHEKPLVRWKIDLPNEG